MEATKMRKTNPLLNLMYCYLSLDVRHEENVTHHNRGSSWRAVKNNMTKLYLHLFAWVDRVGIHFPIEFCPYKVQCTIVSKCTPLGIDKKVWFPWFSIKQLAVLSFLNIAGVTTGTWRTDAIYLYNYPKYFC